MSKSKRLICWLCALLIFSLAACSPAVDQIPNNGTEPTPTATGSNQDEIGPTAQSTQPGAVPATAPGNSSAADALLNTQWRLVSIGAPGSETPLPVGADLTLEFQTEGLAAGSGGCNSFGADYAVQGDSLVFSQLISTMMACTDSNLMDLEQRYFKALQSSGKFEQGDEGLTIHYDQDPGSLNFIPLTNQPTPTPDATGLCSTTAVTSDPAWSLCSSLAYGFEFQFPTGGTLSENTAASARIDLPFTPGTNLTEKYLQLDLQENASPCSSPLAAGYDPGTVPTEPATFNGLQFTKQGGHDAGAGNRYDLTAYSIDQGGTCLSLSFVLHSFVPELKPTPPPVYDPAAELAVFMEIMNTFVWPEAQTTPVPTASQPNQEPQRIEFRGRGNFSGRKRSPGCIRFRPVRAARPAGPNHDSRADLQPGAGQPVRLGCGWQCAYVRSFRSVQLPGQPASQPGLLHPAERPSGWANRLPAYRHCAAA